MKKIIAIATLLALSALPAAAEIDYGACAQNVADADTIGTPLPVEKGMAIKGDEVWVFLLENYVYTILTTPNADFGPNLVERAAAGEFWMGVVKDTDLNVPVITHWWIEENGTCSSFSFLDRVTPDLKYFPHSLRLAVKAWEDAQDLGV